MRKKCVAPSVVIILMKDKTVGVIQEPQPRFSLHQGFQDLLVSNAFA